LGETTLSIVTYFLIYGLITTLDFYVTIALVVFEGILTSACFFLGTTAIFEFLAARGALDLLGLFGAG
jgi:hypothetical protein